MKGTMSALAPFSPSIHRKNPYRRRAQAGQPTVNYLCRWSAQDELSGPLRQEALILPVLHEHGRSQETRRYAARQHLATASLPFKSCLT